MRIQERLKRISELLHVATTSKMTRIVRDDKEVKAALKEFAANRERYSKLKLIHMVGMDMSKKTKGEIE